MKKGDIPNSQFLILAPVYIKITLLRNNLIQYLSSTDSA